MHKYTCLALLLAACSTQGDEIPLTDATVPVISAAAETAPVLSQGDAADDPAFFFNSRNPSKSFILGTDKKSGLYLYTLQGDVAQFLPVGKLNNVDIRPSLRHDDKDSQIAIATNRSDNTVTVFSVTTNGAQLLGAFPTIRKEPYGACLSIVDNSYLVAIPHKTGDLDIYQMAIIDEGVTGTHLQTEILSTQMEGCVFDEENAAFYVGEEAAGITRYQLTQNLNSHPPLQNSSRIDTVGSTTGIVADIEGLTIYKSGNVTGYLIASSQGNNTYAVYDRQTNDFLGRFSIGAKADNTIDGVEETDGIDATSVALPGYPEGIFIAQDGFNLPQGETQNFKIIDWRDIQKTLQE